MDIVHTLSDLPPWVFFALLVFVACAAILARGLPWNIGRVHYVREPTLFSATEWAFLRALDQAVDGRYRVFGKVRVADVMNPGNRTKVGNKRWWSEFTKISSKHVDFVLVDPRTCEIVAAIEVDDRSHQRGDRATRDAFLDRAFQDAGIPLIRYPAKGRGGYKVHEIRPALDAALKLAYGEYA